MRLSEELIWRGFINQTTYSQLSVLDTKKITFYHGFDASADSQTVGNLAAMMMDKVFMRHGHKAVLLAGGATSLIGDPGGKDKERVLQDETTIAHNVQAAEKQLKQIFKEHDFTLVNNLDWYKDMNVMHFLRDVGKHFSMTPLVQRDYIAKRMGTDGSGISYTEFSYTILQGYDFWYLHKKYGVELQLAGSDQWGNSLSGVDYIRRVEGKETHVITCPLVINKATGKKFGKSEEGAVWLDPNKTSVYKFYQFWLNADDEGVEGYLKIFTELDRAVVDDIMKTFHEDPAKRYAQKTLAYEVTKLVHGKDRADSVKKVAEVVFGEADFKNLKDDDIRELSHELPYITTDDHTPLVNLLVRTGLASSNTESRRFIEAGAVYINDEKVEDSALTVSKSDSIKSHVLLRRGKKQRVLVRIG